MTATQTQPIPHNIAPPPGTAFVEDWQSGPRP